MFVAFTFRLEMMRGREVEIAEECETARRHVARARQQFERVKVARCARFLECFESVATNIDGFYKVPFTGLHVRGRCRSPCYFRKFFFCCLQHLNTFLSYSWVFTFDHCMLLLHLPL